MDLIFFFGLSVKILFRMSPLPPPYEQCKWKILTSPHPVPPPPPPGKQNKIITRIHLDHAYMYDPRIGIFGLRSLFYVFLCRLPNCFGPPPPPPTLLNIGTLIKFKSCIGVCIIFKILFSVALTWIK